MGSNSRYIFGVTNLPLTEELRCGRFILNPIPEGQEDLKKLNSMSAECEGVVSAAGRLDIPDELSGSNAWAYVDDQKWGHVELLLSFAHRRSIQMVRPQLIRRSGHKWSWAGTRAHFALPGNPDGVSWYFGHDELQTFMNDCLPQLSTKDDDGRSPLVQALNFFCTNYREDFVELQYLKTFMAFEILYSSYGDDPRILSDRTFESVVAKPLRSRLKDISAEVLSNEAQEKMRDKIPELNRSPARRQASAFLERTFADYPAQRVSVEDVGQFIKIRNQIAHSGRMDHREVDREYSDVLYEQYMRLSSLMERVFLARMGQRPNLMEFTWEYIYFGA
ncbi:MAG: hypothetical protein ACRDHN_02395 [Thermomicrobiales bacterium]